MIGTNRRRMYGGESAPVMEIIHPDAIYFKTNQYAAPDAQYIWQRGIKISEMTKVIRDGIEVSPSEAFVEPYGSGVNLNPAISGEHEYYIYWNRGREISMTLHGFAVMSVIRFSRNVNSNIRKIERVYNNSLLDIIFVDNNVPNISSVVLGNGNLYVPVGSKSSINIGSANIIEVKYKIIED